MVWMRTIRTENFPKTYLKILASWYQAVIFLRGITIRIMKDQSPGLLLILVGALYIFSLIISPLFVVCLLHLWWFQELSLFDVLYLRHHFDVYEKQTEPF